jgi:hypothetical protein
MTMMVKVCLWIAANEAEPSIFESSFKEPASLFESEISGDEENSIDDNSIPLVQPLPRAWFGFLGPMNLAFARSRPWTHGISFDAFHHLPNLLHFDMIQQQLPLLHSLKGVREQVLRFLQLCPLQTIRMNLKVAKLPVRTRNLTRMSKTTLMVYKCWIDFILSSNSRFIVSGIVESSTQTSKL